MISFLKVFYKKCITAALIQELVERRQGLFINVNNSGMLARQIVLDAWKEKPDIFNGKYGNYPHKISTAAYALSLAMKTYSHETPEFMMAMLSLSDILNEVSTHGDLYPFTLLDLSLIDEAIENCSQIMKELSDEK